MGKFDEAFEDFFDRTRDILVSSDIFRFLRLHEKYDIPTTSLGALFGVLKRQGRLIPLGPTLSLMESRQGSRTTVYKWADPLNWDKMTPEQLRALEAVV